MRHIRPLFGECERLCVQLIVQPFQTRGAVSYANVNGKCGWNKRLHVAQGYFKGFDTAADPCQHLQRLSFCSVQGARRQKGEVSCEVRRVGMQFPPEIFNKLSHWTLDVGD